MMQYEMKLMINDDFDTIQNSKVLKNSCIENSKLIEFKNIQ